MSDQPERILVVRLTAIGDVLHGLPVLCALRDRFPDAEIGWMVEGRAGCLLEGHPALDRLIAVPRRWLKSLKAVRQVRRELREFRPDVAIDVQGLTKSAVAAGSSDGKLNFVASLRPGRMQTVKVAPGSYNLLYGLALANGKPVAGVLPGDLKAVEAGGKETAKLALTDVYLEFTATKTTNRINISPSSFKLKGRAGEHYIAFSFKSRPKVIVKHGSREIPNGQMGFG